MRLRKLALAAAIACVSYAGSAIADDTDIRLVAGCSDGSCSSAVDCGCGQPVCGCEATPGCGLLGGAAGGCATGMCDGGCSDGGCASGGCGCLGGGCDLGDQWSLFNFDNGWNVGGWAQLGYHTAALPLFNTRPDEVQLQQGWAYIEKEADGSNGLGIGGRFDAIYGTDGPNTQAFGAGRGWDNGFDNGRDYGFALPQAYLEAAYGDVSVKVGHFYTIIGYEVVTAPDNFFYSHAYTFNFSEPFTHTGALATMNVSDDLTVWSGYTLGWDSGFNDNGDAFLGGFSTSLTDRLTVTYATTFGRFGEARFNGVEKGYMHSIVTDFALTDSLQLISQSDYLDTEEADGTPARETFGLNHYLIKTINDCWAVGGRFEWWSVDEFNGAAVDADVYALTLGVNYKPHANVVIRPEVRWDWDDDLFVGLEDGDVDQFTFGIDSIFLF